MSEGERRRPRRRNVGLAAVLAVLMTGTVLVPSGASSASSDAAVPMTSFSESSTCGRPYVGTPIMSRSGGLADTERILGPLGRVLGRTIGEARSAQVTWVVPMSGGRTAKVHRAALAAFRQVSANLADAAARGLWYPVDSVAAFVPRTIGGARQLSRHALGISIDINPSRNPFSPDPDAWTTDLPPWYIQAWRDAGFCWGGDWAFSKDPMHFSWMGPAAGSGGLDLLPALGSVRPYTRSAEFTTGWAGLVDGSTFMLADMTGFGATDVVRVRDHPNGMVIEVMPARSSFGRCSVYRWMLEGRSTADGLVALGDIDGDSRADAVVLSPSGTLWMARRADRFTTVDQSTAPVPSDLRLVAVADHTGDRRGDLHLLGREGRVTVLAAPGFTEVVADYTVPQGVVHLAGGDRDGDGEVEMFAAAADGTVHVLGRSGDTYLPTEIVSADGGVAFSSADIDGDLRSDLTFLSPDATLAVWIGNSPTGRGVSSWWVNPDHECPDDPIGLTPSGRFYDDDGSGFEWAIEAIAASGVTRGCNPPFEDAFCPTDNVSRGEMASFLARALTLPASDVDHFTDDDGSAFEPDIDRMAAAGITLGCDSGRFCPNGTARRGEMAAFLTRALSLAPGPADPFGDDDGHAFEAEIAALAAGGITTGCGPRRFCPEDPVLRQEMAAFLARIP